jgi:hypothetical protein
MLIFDLFNLSGSVSLLICTVLCTVAVGQGRTRRKLLAYKQMLFERVLHF